MLVLQKTIQTTWEKARGSLREDLVQIELVMNKLWGRAFGVDLKLKNSVVEGDGGPLQIGDDNNVEAGPIDLTDEDNVEGRLSFSHLPEIAAGKVVGRRSTSDGDMEEITPEDGINLVDFSLKSIGAVVGKHTLCGGI